MEEQSEAPKEEILEKDSRCYAPSCHFWDGNSECTCKREKILHFSD